MSPPNIAQVFFLLSRAGWLLAAETRFTEPSPPPPPPPPSSSSSLPPPPPPERSAMKMKQMFACTMRQASASNLRIVSQASRARPNSVAAPPPPPLSRRALNCSRRVGAQTAEQQFAPLEGERASELGGSRASRRPHPASCPSVRLSVCLPSRSSEQEDPSHRCASLGLGPAAAGPTRATLGPPVHSFARSLACLFRPGGVPARRDFCSLLCIVLLRCCCSLASSSELIWRERVFARLSLAARSAGGTLAHEPQSNLLHRGTNFRAMNFSNSQPKRQNNNNNNGLCRWLARGSRLLGRTDGQSSGE